MRGQWRRRPRGAFATCDTCGGHGAVRQVSRSIFGQVVQERACPACAGRGSMITDPCTDCSGTGEQPEERTVTRRRSPPASRTVSASGSPVAAAQVRMVAPPATSTSTCACADDDRFIREGDDLDHRARPDRREAALGTTARYPTVDGDDRELEIADGTQPGTRMVIRGLGAGRLRGGAQRAACRSTAATSSSSATCVCRTT